MIAATKILNAQDLFDVGGEWGAGFNTRISGWDYQEANGYPAYPSADRASGWQRADQMIEAGKIYYYHRFRHIARGEVCNGYAFPYGGTFVCNECGWKDLKKPWMAVKVYKDGNAWCCIGTPFINLQASDNYAFGDTREEALNKYEALMHERELAAINSIEVQEGGK